MTKTTERGAAARSGLDLRVPGPVFAISLHQPWASFLAWGFKTIETRSWQFGLGHARRVCHQFNSRLAIHAAKTKLHDAMLPELWHFAGLPGSPPPVESLEHGCVVALVEFRGCGPVELAAPTSRDVALGNFSSERFAWHFGHVDQLLEPVPVKGRQGIFRLEHDDGVDVLDADFKRVR